MSPYTAEPTNFTASDALQAVRTPALRGYLVDDSVPWDAVDLGMDSALPQNPKDRTEFNLLVGDGIARFVWRSATARWYQIGASPILTSLPTVPDTVVGMNVVYVADSANSVLWNLTYYPTGSATYPWACVGGSPMAAYVDTSQTTASITYVNLGTTGPTVTLPLAGDYIIDHGCRAANNTGDQGIMSYSIGASAASDANAISNQSGGVNYITSVSRRMSVNVASASSAITAKYRGNLGGTATFDFRFVMAMPDRVV